MKTTVSIRNMLRLTEAEIPLESGRVTVVSGANAQGKTSIATLVGAALAAEGNPLGAAGKNARLYLHDGRDAGGVEISIDDEPALKWDASSGDVSNFRSGQSSQATVGLVDFTTSLSPAARTAVFESYFLPGPAELRDMIQAQLEPHLSDRRLDEIMSLVDEGQMSSVVDSYARRARDAKASWTRITGEGWGSKKGADWIPEGWSATLDGIDETAAQQAVKDAEAVVQSLTVDVAVTAAEVDRSKAALEQIPALEEALAARRKTLSDAKESHDHFQGNLDRVDASGRAAKARLQSLRSDIGELVRMQPRESDHQLCPGCGMKLALSDGAILEHDEAAWKTAYKAWERKLETLNEDRKTTETDHAGFQKKWTDMKPAVDQSEKALDEARTAVADAEAEIRQAQLASENADAKIAEVDAEGLQTAQKALKVAEGDLELVRKRQAATAHHTDILDYTLIAQILGPKGVRSMAMQKAMVRFDQVLEKIHAVTGWPRVNVDKTYAVSIGGRAFLKVCAESERLMAQFSIQIALSRCMREQYVILDRADDLDDGNLAALFDLLDALCERPSPPAFLVAGTDVSGREAHIRVSVADGVTRTLPAP